MGVVDLDDMVGGPPGGIVRDLALSLITSADGLHAELVIGANVEEVWWS